jgi:uncharacterized protein YqhQ
MWPGLKLQALTTADPGRGELEVAVAALSAVLAVEDPAAPVDRCERIEVVA